MITSVIGGALVLSATAGAQTACPRCDRQLNLSESEWTCLVERMPELLRGGTPLVFFTLSRAMCRQTRQMTRLPPVTDGAPPYLQMRLDQLKCLNSKAARIHPTNGRYIVDLVALCPGDF